MTNQRPPGGGVILRPQPSLRGQISTNLDERAC